MPFTQQADNTLLLQVNSWVKSLPGITLLVESLGTHRNSTYPHSPVTTSAPHVTQRKVMPGELTWRWQDEEMVNGIQARQLASLPHFLQCHTESDRTRLGELHGRMDRQLRHHGTSP